MPDQNLTEQTTVQETNSNQPDITALEQMAFPDLKPQNQYANNFIQPTIQNQATQETATTQETTTEVATTQQTQQTTHDEPEMFDADEYLRKELGYENWDLAKAEIERLRKLESNGGIQLPNDEAKKWYDYIAQGKEEELLNNLSARQKLKNVENLNDEQRLKLYIKMQNPLFDDELVDDEYNSLYLTNEEKFKNQLDEIDHVALRKEKLRTQQRIMNDVQKANEYFSQFKSKIELPILQQQQQKDDAYESYKAATAKDSVYLNDVVVPSINALKENEVSMNFNVDDEKNQIKFAGTIEVTPDDLKAAKQRALNFAAYLDEISGGKEDKFNSSRFLQMILRDMYFEKYAQAISKQAIMSERKAKITKDTMGGNAGFSRDFNIEQNQALKQFEQFAFQGQ